MEKEIRILESEIRDIQDKINYLKEELKNKENKKEHKSLSDYRIYCEPTKLQEYKYICQVNEIRNDAWCNTSIGKTRLATGNVYSIKTPNELLEREIKKRKLCFELEKHLKENNCLATYEDWEDTGKMKYLIYYNFANGESHIGEYHCCKYSEIYSTNKKILQNYMDTLSEEDIKIMFDVD